MATSSGAAAGGGLSLTDLQIGWQYRAACKGPVSNLFFAPNHLDGSVTHGTCGNNLQPVTLRLQPRYPTTRFNGA